MSTLLSALGFAAQFFVITSFAAVVISSVCLRTDDFVLVSEDRPSGAVVSVDDGSNATLSDTARVTCAKSMASPVYVTTIDESSVSPDDYSAMTVVTLKALCKSRGVKRYSSLRKHELVELLSAL